MLQEAWFVKKSTEWTTKAMKVSEDVACFCWEMESLVCGLTRHLQKDGCAVFPAFDLSVDPVENTPSQYNK